jgi:hypothetical protein
MENRELKKINICIDYNTILPLSKWHNDVFTDNFFKDSHFKFTAWKHLKKEENNFLFLYCVPEDTVNFLQSAGDNFYDTIKDKKIKILFYNEQFNIFMKDENIFKLDFGVARRCHDHNNELYWKLKNIFTRFNIGEESFYFLHNAKGFINEIEQMKSRKILRINSTIEIKSKHLEINDWLIWGKKKDIIAESNITYHYACLFAGRPAQHRHDLITNLWKENLLKFGKCSLTRYGDENNQQTVPALPPHGVINSHFTNIPENDIFKDIFLWVAAETYVPNGYPYFTEKTIKAILYERPFLSYGNTGTLAYLRDYGFKTFGEFWDESYDNEKNNDKKIKMLTAIIQDLCKKSINEIKDMHIKMQSILVYNKKLLHETEWQRDLIKFLS